MTTPQFTLQKSYRDLVEGEVLKSTDEYYFNQEWTLCHPANYEKPYKTTQKLNEMYHFRHRRPIHRQPDGSWRDEGEETEKAHKIWFNELVEGLAALSKETPVNFRNQPEYFKSLVKCVFAYFQIPLEPEQEEWEKAYESYKIYATEEPMTKEAFKIVFELGRALERKQGEKK